MTAIPWPRTHDEPLDLVEPGPDATVDQPGAVPTPLPTRRHRRSGLGQQLATRWAPILLSAWVVIFTLGVNLEPTAATNDDSALDLVFGSMLLLSWAVMLGGFVQRRRYGALASNLGAASLVVMTFTCPLSGHHTAIGAWWWFQLTGSLTLLGLSGTAFLARNRQASQGEP